MASMPAGSDRRRPTNGPPATNRELNLPRLLWSAAHWRRRHEVRAARPNRLVRTGRPGFSFVALLSEAKQVLPGTGATTQTSKPGFGSDQGDRGGLISGRGGPASPD